MLQCLHIRDLALIASAEVRFQDGLNVISGETGGGKSLVVAALKLLRGEKASAGQVRHGADELCVDGEFALGSGERSRAVAAAVRELCGFELEEEVLLVTRIVDKHGRSRVRIAGRPAPLASLRALGELLLEIHGQGDTRMLMRPDVQSETLDAFARTAQLRERFADRLRSARAIRERLTSQQRGESERRERADFLRYQLGEIDAVGLVEGETQSLEDEHRLLAHLDRMRELLDTALQALQDDEASAADQIARGERALAAAAEIDARLLGAAELVASAREAIADACREVQSRSGDLDLDPARLAIVEERLATVRRALQRYGPSESELFERRVAIAAELESLEDEVLGAALEQELATALGELAELGRKLVKARRKAAPGLVAAIEGELAALAMPHTKFRVEQSEEVADGIELLDVATAHGPGPVEFLVRVNPGESFHPMRETASGGEAARIVLAVKKCLADQDRVPFLVFDEIDAEIGGRLGLAVGRKLADVARDHQVLIVTHLPQVAAFANAHFLVAKRVEHGRAGRCARSNASTAPRPSASSPRWRPATAPTPTRSPRPGGWSSGRGRSGKRRRRRRPAGWLAVRTSRGCRDSVLGP